MAHVWPEDDLQDSDSPSHHVDPRDSDGAVKLGDRLLDLLGHFAIQFLLIY